ncbi:hypothetical protein CY35_17G087700 [Sphagnum magellanicum]|nr:hypothetical protein CY35_17G087700 [Sphagnum magellanicum]
MLWQLGGRHSSIQLCISYLQEPTKLCFGEFLIHIFYFLSNDRCNIKGLCFVA